MKQNKKSYLSGIRSLKFPSNSRFITERHISILKKTFFGLVASTLFFAFVLLVMDTHATFEKKQKNETERVSLLQEEQYWQKIAQTNPTYRDSYFNLALLAYRLGSYENAKKYTEKTLSIDPNFEPALKLQKLLESK